MFSDPIQTVGRGRYYDEIFSRAVSSGSGSDSATSGSGSESGSNGYGGQSQAGSPEVCQTPERQGESAYRQLAEPRVYPEVTGQPPQQAFAFDFDFDNGVWVSGDRYAQLGNNPPKDQPDWLIQGLSFPAPFV